MTQIYHTPILTSPKQPGNAAVFNAPLGQLDAAIANLEAEVESLNYSNAEFSGTVTAAHFVGDGSGLTGIGTGTGGVINTGSTTVGADSDADGIGVVALQTGGTTRLQIAATGEIELPYAGDDDALTFTGVRNGTDLSTHSIRDETTFISADTGSYASFDAALTLDGTTAYDHYHAFQARPVQDSTGKTGRLASFWAEPTANGPVQYLYGLHVKEALGAGTIDVQAGVRIEALTRGAQNYGIYQLGASTPNYFQGNIQSSGRVYTSGSMDAETLGVGGANSGAGIVEINATGSGSRQYGLFEAYNYTGTADVYGNYATVSAENGQTSGSNSIYGIFAQAGMTGKSGDCYAAVLDGVFSRASLNAGAGNDVTAITVNTLRAESPNIAGAGNVVIGYISGLKVSNQGTNKANTSYGIKVEDQSGSTSANYAIYTGDGTHRIGSSTATLGFYGVTPISRAVLATGAGATVDNVITALQNLGLVKQS